MVYQVYPRSFADSDGDGIGDLAGLRGRLDHLSDLGADVVWLSPVYPSPQDDAGYDISDYTDVDPVFGSLEELDRLLDAVHARGMRLVMDLVVNHTSDEHPWFVESRSGRDSSRRDWYWWRPPRSGAEPGTPGAEPNNWRSNFSGSAWEFDPDSREYYLHLFSSKQPDLNWENPEVRQAVHAMMRWWLDRGVDGFRMDVINFISKPPALLDAALRPGEVYADGFEHYASGPRIHEFLQEMHREVFAGRDPAPLTVGEMPGVTVDDARLFTDPARGEVDMVFQFEHVRLDVGVDKWDVRGLDLRDLKACLGAGRRAWPTWAGTACTGRTTTSRASSPASGTTGTTGWSRRRCWRLCSTCTAGRRTSTRARRSGWQTRRSPRRRLQRHRVAQPPRAHGRRRAGARGGRARRAARAEPRQRAYPDAVGRDAVRGLHHGHALDRVNPDHTQVNVAAQRDDPDSVLAHYRRLVRLRHEEPVVVEGDFTMLLPDDPRVYAFTRRLGDVELLVLGNVSGTTAPAPVPGAAAWAACEVLVGRVGAPGTDAEPLVLAPWEGRVYRRTGPGGEA